jgi:hypothetical protein
VLILPLALCGLSRTVRAVTVTEHVLHIPTAFGFKRIPVSAIAGVGMFYRCVVGTNGGLKGWMPEVWDITERRFKIDRFVQQSGLSPRLRHIPVVSTTDRDASNLLMTPQGFMATEMYNWVLEHQGPTGPLAWWSPDQTMGPVH